VTQGHVGSFSGAYFAIVVAFDHHLLLPAILAIMPFGDAEQNSAQRQAMLRVIESLQDPERGFACAIAFAGLMMQCDGFWNGHAWENDPEKREEKDIMHQYRTAVFRWVTYARTPAERQELVGSSCTCHAQERSDVSHRFGSHVVLKDISIQPFFYVLRLLLETMITPLDHQEVHSDRDVRIDRLAMRKAWPTSLQEILPHGPENTTRSLLAWIKTVFGEAETTDALLRVSHLFLSYTHPATFPYFVTSQTFTTHVIRAIDRACEYYEKNSWNTVASHQVVRTLSAVAQVAATAMLARSTNLQRRLMTETHAVELTVAYSRALDVCDSLRGFQGARMRDTETAFRLLGDTAIQDFELLQDERFQRAIRSPHKLMERFTSELNTPWTSMIAAIDCETRSQTCASPDCSKTYADSSAFKKCGGCRRVVYHSRECQKRAWNHPVAPHRDICSILRQVSSVNQLPKTRIRRVSHSQHPRFNAEQGALIVRHFAMKSFHEVHNLRKCH
jgi:hypothetical protein